jgi:hypothetical protein
VSPEPFRPVRRQDIQFKRSLFRFTVVFSLVLIAGFVTRYSLSRIPLKEKIMQASRMPKDFELVVDRPEIRLKSGLLPVFGVAVNRLDILNSQCPTQKVSAQDLMIRLDPFALMFGKAELGVLNVDFLEVTFSEGCRIQTVSEKNVGLEKINPVSPSQPKSPTQVSDRGLGTTFDFVSQVLKKPPLKKINVDRFEIHYLESLQRQIKADGRLKVRLKDKLTADMDLKNIYVGQKDFSFVSTQVTVSSDVEGLILQLTSDVREGQLDSKIEIKNQNGFPTSLKASIKKLPLSSLVSAVYGRKELSYLWATCELAVESPWAELQSQQLSTSGCKIDGPYGEVIFNEIQARLDRLIKLDAELKSIDLDKVLKDKRDFYFSGVFSNYGVLSSKLQYQSGQWQIDGELNNSEFIFSNNNLRDIQKVKKLPFRLQGRQANWSAQLFDIELEEGSFAGELKVQGSDSGPSSGRVAVHKLRLNPRIYKLMVNSQPADLRVYGKFKASKEGLEEWTAMIATPQLNSEFYEFNNLKVKGGGGADKIARLKVTVGDGSLAGKGPLFDWIQPTHLEKTWDYEKLKFKELSTRLELAKDRSLKWKRGYIYLNNGWQLSTEGERSGDRQVQAWLQWDRPDRKYLKWQYQGSFFKGEWSPETPWVQEWLRKNPDFLKQNDSVLFSAVDEKTITDKINRAGKKAIEKVKDVLKGGDQEKGS